MVVLSNIDTSKSEGMSGKSKQIATVRKSLTSGQAFLRHYSRLWQGYRYIYRCRAIKYSIHIKSNMAASKPEVLNKFIKFQFRPNVSLILGAKFKRLQPLFLKSSLSMLLM